MTNSIILDKNIVIDLIAGRARKPKILEILKNFDEIYISINTYITSFYILRKEYTKEEVYNHISMFEILEIDKTDCHLAYNLAVTIDDVEDCLELFTCKRNNAKIITADQQMALKYGAKFDLMLIE